MTDAPLWAGEVLVHGVKVKGPKSGGARFEDGDVVGVMVEPASGRVAFFRNGVLARAVSPGVRPGVPVLPFVSLGAADLAALLVPEPARVPPPPAQWAALPLAPGGRPGPPARPT